MKKSLIALAVLAASGTAMAQSSVTLFGIVDTNITHVNNANAAGDSVTGMGHSGNATSRIGFRGVEDLGGGLKAGFWLEAGHNPDVGDGRSGGATSGGLEFKRRSTISLMGGFGEVRLGRDLVPSYTKVSSYDVFGQVGIGQFKGWDTWGQPTTTSDGAGHRQSNMVSYYTPNFGGFTGGLGYGLDEQTAGKKGRYMGGFAAFDNGPLSVTVALDRRHVNYDLALPTVPPTALEFAGTKDMFSLGAAYDLGMVKITALGQQTRFKGIASATVTPGLFNYEDRKINAYMVGAAAPVGAGQVRIQYALYDQKAISSKAHQLSLGYVHNLSKRTAVYGTLAHIRNKDASNLALNASGVNGVGPGAGNNQTGLALGVRHAF